MQDRAERPLRIVRGLDLRGLLEKCDKVLKSEMSVTRWDVSRIKDIWQPGKTGIDIFFIWQAIVSGPGLSRPGPIF